MGPYLTSSTTPGQNGPESNVTEVVTPPPPKKKKLSRGAKLEAFTSG